MTDNNFEGDVSIANEEINDFYEENSKDAEEILNDEDKMERFFQKLEKKLKVVPIAGDSLAYIPLLMSLVRHYVKKEYTDPPIASMTAIVVALIYFVSPIDIIPDITPIVGYLDDALVLSGCIALVRTDIEDYKNWRKKNGLEIEDMPEYSDIAADSEQINKFARAFFRGKKSVAK